MTMGDDDPRGVANLDHRGMIGSFNEGGYFTKYKISMPHDLREDVFFYVFPLYDNGR